jgi:hypothetical protein
VKKPKPQRLESLAEVGKKLDETLLRLFGETAQDRKNHSFGKPLRVKT